MKHQKIILVLFPCFILICFITICMVYGPSFFKNQVQQKARKSTVSVFSGIDMEKEIMTEDMSIGSGFCFDENGKILTNYHNVDGGNIHIVTDDGSVHEARIIAKDETFDIAIIQADIDLPPLKMKDSNNYEIGQSVFSFSTPLSLYLRQTYSDGILTNIDIQGFGTQTLLQTNMDLSPGCSGAPLFNNADNVIGMITYKSTQFGVEGL